MCLQVYFQVLFYFEILNLVHRTLVHPLSFSKYLNKYSMVPFALSLADECFPVSTAPDKEAWFGSAGDCQTGQEGETGGIF